VVEISPAHVERQLGVRIPGAEIVRILTALEFTCDITGDIADPLVAIKATVPEHRLDIGAGLVGKADLVEEIARIYGYDRIPDAMLAEVIPPPHPNRDLELEERLRDTLAGLGLQEVVTYSLTSPERESRLRLTPPAEGDAETPFVRLANPIVVDRVVMRRTLLAGLLETAAANSRQTDRLAFFEVGNVFLAEPGQPLPVEQVRVGILMAGARTPLGWQPGDRAAMDFFDVKGVVEELAEALAVPGLVFEPGTHDALRPGRTAQVSIQGAPAGWIGELHPAIAERFELKGQTVIVSELDLPPFFDHAVDRHPTRPVPVYPAVKEDLAFVLDQGVAVARVQELITKAGGPLLAKAVLFDEFQGEKLGAGKRSLAFALTYQAPDRTLTDADAKKIRDRIVQALAAEMGATLRA
jgi:phenylalanyl-tRNA synthetase beta chain